MITIHGEWVMEGLEGNDPNRIKTSRELGDIIRDIGFLPLFKNKIEGFSVEERTASSAWWSGSTEDPWAWRETIAADGDIAYGKLFQNRAGFVSKEWYPVFAAFRRDGYDFDSRYEDGLASYRSKLIMDVFQSYDTLPSYQLKELAGFGRSGEKGFDGVLNTLQMQTYLTVKEFKRKINKKGEAYGWSVASYTTPENLYGEEYVRSAYHRNAKDAKGLIVNKLQQCFPNVSAKDIEGIIK